jgi:hypothetical protein
MSEVICIKDYSEQIQWLMQTHGIVAPKKGDTFHITATEERDGTTWYKFAEYPDTVMAPNYGYTHWFECVYFGVIDALQADIDAALAAPKPKESIKTMDFAHLNVEQTRCALAMAKLNLMDAKTYHDFRVYRDQCNALYAHLQNITYNA